MAETVFGNPGWGPLLDEDVDVFGRAATAGLGGGGMSGPLSMLSGLPSFNASGGHAAPSMARSDSTATAIMNSPFTVGGAAKGTVETVARDIAPMLLAGVAIWLVLTRW